MDIKFCYVLKQKYMTNSVLLSKYYVYTNQLYLIITNLNIIVYKL